MHKGQDNPVVSEDSIVQDALFLMTEKGLGAVSVVDEDGKLVGLVTDGDVRRGLETGSNFLQWPVDAMMTKNRGSLPTINLRRKPCTSWKRTSPVRLRYCPSSTRTIKLSA